MAVYNVDENLTLVLLSAMTHYFLVLVLVLVSRELVLALVLAQLVLTTTLRRCDFLLMARTQQLDVMRQCSCIHYLHLVFISHRQVVQRLVVQYSYQHRAAVVSAGE